MHGPALFAYMTGGRQLGYVLWEVGRKNLHRLKKYNNTLFYPLGVDKYIDFYYFCKQIFL